MKKDLTIIFMFFFCKYLDKPWTVQPGSSAVVTALCVSQGMLWVGTSTGLILTLPLPRLRLETPRLIDIYVE